MDIIYLNDLEVETVIGIFDWEREIKQLVRIDLQMAADIGLAAKSDSIEDTLNYKSVAKRIIQFVQESTFQLVESLAEGIAQILLREFHIPWVKVAVNKPGAIRYAADVGVIIERGDKSVMGGNHSL